MQRALLPDRVLCLLCAAISIACAVISVLVFVLVFQAQEVSFTALKGHEMPVQSTPAPNVFLFGRNYKKSI